VRASRYLDPARFALERERIFRRLPLALSCELRRPGAYRALTAAGVPVLLVRGSDGAVRAFLNRGGHRGAQVVLDGAGTARRFVCPYHAWTYDERGALVGVFQAEDFGELDRACHGLAALPAAERAGLVFVTLDPASRLDADAFLCGYDALLAQLGFERWHLVGRREVAGPNWKIAYDGYLQRREEDWGARYLLGSVWTIFPHVSIASFDAGGRGVLISQRFPGASVGESVTVQSFLVEQEPSDEARAAAEKAFELLGFVVREEDYATGLRQQRALASDPTREVLFGRNEGGGQRFHRWVDHPLGTGDDAPAKAFRGEIG
jgi:carnitine monooxygenase subunit